MTGMFPLIIPQNRQRLAHPCRQAASRIVLLSQRDRLCVPICTTRKWYRVENTIRTPSPCRQLIASRVHLPASFLKKMKNVLTAVGPTRAFQHLTCQRRTSHVQ